MSRSIALAATALWLLAGAPAPIAATVPSDGRIEAQVKNALEDEPALHDSVHVTAVQDGVVFLGSGAATLAGQLRAIAAVSRVPGVREVRMRVTGGGEPREDQLMRVAVADRPEASPSGHAVRDDASSEDELGHPDAIRITPDMAAAAQQASLAMAHGVKRFVRNIRDAWITAEAETALLVTPAVPARQLAVHTTRRVVTLSGTVPSQQAEDAAVRAAGDVAGVRRVDDALVVAGAHGSTASG